MKIKILSLGDVIGLWLKYDLMIYKSRLVLLSYITLPIPCQAGRPGLGGRKLPFYDVFLLSVPS